MAPPPRSLGESLLRSFRLAHDRLLTAAEEMSPEQFIRSGGPTLHSVAWQLWHAARWDDVFASYFHKAAAQDPRAQVWEREALADRWSIASGSAGRRDTGTEMSDEAAEQMQFPVQEEVVRYARLAFAYADEAITLISDEQLLAAPSVEPEGDTKLDNVLVYLEHLSRHLGVIESIRALQTPTALPRTET
ncbi:MAG TPA: DinB family protein [Candidatus Dormibacteraeota bacterium]|nr:DinB family protein [Candidatus Dormibacteraeota bacterium]